MNVLLIFFLIGTARTEFDLGTVLFTERDLDRSCWNVEQLVLLQSRRIMEDLIPADDSITGDDSIVELLDYFHVILKIIKKHTIDGRTKQIILSATLDVIGGYLKHLIIPKVKAAFYGGLVDYNNCYILLDFYQKIQQFLHTNGEGWSRSIKIDEKMIKTSRSNRKKIDSYSINNCNQLIIDSKRIPMPFFDSSKNPTAIAVPYKIFPLRSIDGISSANLLEKYFVESEKCLLERKTNTDEFKQDFLKFIKQEVLPLVDNQKFYAAFGGIFKIYKGLKSKSAIIEGTEPTVTTKEESEKKSSKRFYFILVTLLATIFIWFLLGALYICNRIKADRKNKDEENRSEKRRIVSEIVIQPPVNRNYESNSMMRSKPPIGQSLSTGSTSSLYSHEDVLPDNSSETSFLRDESHTSHGIMTSMASSQIPNRSSKTDQTVMYSRISEQNFIPLREISREMLQKHEPYVFGYDYETSTTSDSSF